jgi:tRNA threonylcarbamoyladenosine biosynthesis protein TsaB
VSVARSSPPDGWTLALDASTPQGTVALLNGSRVVREDVVTMRAEGAELLMPAVAHTIDAVGIEMAQVERVVCGAGPGGFTSLRIAAAIAKGLVSSRVASRQRPLHAVSSLLLIVAGAVDRLAVGQYLATLDALRGERYAMLIDVEVVAAPGRPMIRPLSPARRLGQQELDHWARESGATVIGPGCPMDAWPGAGGVAHVWSAVVDVDVAAWQPEYGRLAEAQVRRDEALRAGRTV